MLGSQGGDVFFTYRLTPRKTNLGRSLHALPASQLFEMIIDANPSYIAGFASHYALDSTLHPAVYAYVGNKKAPFVHLNFESDLGLYISRKYNTPRKILPKESVIGATFPVYDAISRIEDNITVTGIERCLKRHFSYTRILYKNKRQTYKYDYNFSSLSGTIDDSVEFGTRAVCAILDGTIPQDIFNKSFLEK
jgi:hypothetical protein